MFPHDLPTAHFTNCTPRFRTLGYRPVPIERCALLSTLIWLACGWITPAQAAPITLTTAAGLSPGDQFRFIFVTDGVTPATSDQISYYNSFVQSQADGATYNGVTVTWQAVGSTATVNAIDNIGQTQTPVYLVSGTEIAPSTTASGLWSGSVLHVIDEDIQGQLIYAYTWTGTNAIGGTADYPLGDTYLTTNIGYGAAPNSYWVNDGYQQTDGDYFMYGISQVLTVPNAIPEPSSLLLGLIIAAYGCTRLHREKKKRGHPQVGH